MMRGFVIFALILFLSLDISASCNETQININTANSTELDEITPVGPATAENIINYRQNNRFDSVDELLNVSGIGSAKLVKIKAQGLACVEEIVGVTSATDSMQTENDQTSNEEIINETNQEAVNNTSTNRVSGKTTTTNSVRSSLSNNQQIINLTPISLNAALHEFNSYYRAT